MYVAEQQGQVIGLRNLAFGKRMAGGGKRAAVTGFSVASRRRLIDLMARLDTSQVRTTFITLTFSSIPTATFAKQALLKFRKRLFRKHSNVSIVWRMEYQKRGSIHFHLIAFGLPFIDQAELQNTWTECTGEERSIVDIRLVRSSTMLMKYVSKYVAKPTDADGSTSLENNAYLSVPCDEWQGRVWGIWNKTALPVAPRHACVITDDAEAERLANVIEVMSHGYGKARFSPYWKLFSAQAKDIYRFSTQKAGRPYQRWKSISPNCPPDRQNGIVQRCDKFFNVSPPETIGLH